MHLVCVLSNRILRLDWLTVALCFVSRYYNFNDLLNDLTGKLPSSLNLPYGVRQIFTPVGGRRVSDIEDLQDGETYVCAGFEGFKVIKYGRTELEPWSVGKSG